MQEEKSKWVKYGAIFAILIMVGSGVFVGLMYWDGLTGDENATIEYPFADVPGTHANFTFKNAKDAAQYVPEDVLSINILKVYDNDTIDQTLQTSFPGAEPARLLTASYLTGGLEYVVLESEENVSIVLNGSKPQYEDYEDYNIIFISPYQRVIAGNPLIIASFYNYVADNSLAKKAVDVLAGKSAGSTTLNDILEYADDTETYDEIIVYKANNGSNYEKYYQRSSQYVNMTTFQLAFQLESIILNPNDEMKQAVYDLAENASEGIEFTITEEDNVMKTYVDGADYTSFMTDTNALYKLISDHTKQSTTA
ncbi:hypothetical protein MmiHf6_17890 [Methanimicrococcus hongohii]|uniref:Uncharacterized protein n=1 Tax=Methanimicrococcus hongohii TaxID=3028295 RepID=A0AA96VCX8_9EURY|nr:hypothetical protein [Methanimicrococcus sp. Hf6]WNY24452.1 hypothetical protein MmiHf6_17890 [Methanimicrococcus sp. Hf6]